MIRLTYICDSCSAEEQGVNGPPFGWKELVWRPGLLRPPDSSKPKARHPKHYCAYCFKNNRISIE